MATLTWGDVVIIGLVAFVGFTLLSYWVSAAMAKRSITGQLKGKPPKPKDAAPLKAKPPAGAAKPNGGK